MKITFFLLALMLSSVLSTLECRAQNYLTAKTETLTFVLDLSGTKVNSNIKNDFSALDGIELSRYCERPELKQALMILKIDRTICSDNNAIHLFLENAGVTIKPVSDNNYPQLQQFFCQ